MIAILAFIVSLFLLIAGCGKNQSEAPPGGDQTEAVADSTGKAANTDSTVSFLKIDKEYKNSQISQMFSIEQVMNNATPLSNLSVAYYSNPFNHNETSALTNVKNQNIKSSSNDLFANYMTKAPAKLGDQFVAVTPVTKYDIMND